MCAWRRLLPLLAALLCRCAAAGKKRALRPLRAFEAENPPEYPRVFPRGVLNPAWANDKDSLAKIYKSLRQGKPVVISDFLTPPIADALAKKMGELADAQDDDDLHGYPFEFHSEGERGKAKRKWRPHGKTPCASTVKDFIETDDMKFAFRGHILIGRERAKHNAWFQAFRQAMAALPLRRFWQQLAELPAFAEAWDASWSWLRPGDYYGLHADDATMRYLSISIHLVGGPAAAGDADIGGELLWCGPDGTANDLLIESPGRAHFFKSFNVSRNGSVVVPGYNTAVVFPVFRNSYHAVAPVKPSKTRRFTLQGWYVDPCHFQPPNSECVDQAMLRLQAWSKTWADRAPNTQPPTRLVTKEWKDEL